jgi:hypothetical protein
MQRTQQNKNFVALEEGVAGLYEMECPTYEISSENMFSHIRTGISLYLRWLQQFTQSKQQA